MKDTDKTKEQLINELDEIRRRVNEAEKLCSKYKKAVETLLSFEKALETMQIGVTICDLEGKILYTNPADLDMHGYKIKELKENSVRIFAPVETWKPLTKDEISSMKRWKRESINKRKDGYAFPVQLMSDAVTNVEGEVTGIVTTCEDITERKEMEKEIMERVEDLERFYEMSVGRELKMKDLKKEIKKLKSDFD
ncbi:MAG: PAS domain S-box protein [Thermodesulfovibrionia bacterium]|nr:PAS domain S-box protein [Thermodesulfovibrionia bacterium]